MAFKVLSSYISIPDTNDWKFSDKEFCICSFSDGSFNYCKDIKECKFRKKLNKKRLNKKWEKISLRRNNG